MLAVAGAVVAVVELTGGASARLGVSTGPLPSLLPPGPKLPVLPDELRGVHVTMSLANVPGKLDDYIALDRYGLNAIELDVKDESGNVAFVSGAPTLALRSGAARPYYDPVAVARKVHRAGLYLIGRVVSFEDPIVSAKAPTLAIRRADGSLWKTNGGLGWLNPYNRQAWRYDVDVAAVAARAGFDEIQFDYVRFPSDGDLSLIRYPGRHPQPMQRTIPAFLRYAARRLHPLGVRVSADVFGLSATRDLGIGQDPHAVGAIVDSIYPMTYPSHYRSGEFGLDDPNAAPATTVTDSLRDFHRALAGRKALLVPWLQDFSLGRTYGPEDVAAQIKSARTAATGGYMLWNAGGLYTAQELAAVPLRLPPLERPHL